jgi:hypothetical protein
MHFRRFYGQSHNLLTVARPFDIFLSRCRKAGVTSGSLILCVVVLATVIRSVLQAF